jgi:hypothetical protein
MAIGSNYFTIHNVTRQAHLTSELFFCPLLDPAYKLNLGSNLGTNLGTSRITSRITSRQENRLQISFLSAYLFKVIPTYTLRYCEVYRQCAVHRSHIPCPHTCFAHIDSRSLLSPSVCRTYKKAPQPLNILPCSPAFELPSIVICFTAFEHSLQPGSL